ncbi:antibiotic biosynthesis monooxygenase [Dehalobacter sp. DCM]|uniref:antibiotic biosynthesis monooxygenase n=1 Tax=Dehalobacter sp. DCM TaxID=2907827 RepID=UPI0030818C6B|nr:antibiotic biosynthesis monooxygenase [Dehalobacter sp. DCM]
MINVFHTFQSPDLNTVLPEIHNSLQSMGNVSGFKYVSLNQKENTQDYLLVSKWDDHAAYENWKRTIGSNNPIVQATPEFLNVMEERY